MQSAAHVGSWGKAYSKEYKRDVWTHSVTNERRWSDPLLPPSQSMVTDTRSNNGNGMMFEGFVGVNSVDLDKFAPRTKKLSHVFGRREVKQRFIKIRSFDYIENSNGRPVGLVDFFRDDESLTPSLSIIPASISRENDLTLMLVDSENRNLSLQFKMKASAAEFYECVLDLCRKATPQSSPQAVRISSVVDAVTSSSVPNTNNAYAFVTVQSSSAPADNDTTAQLTFISNDTDAEAFSTATRNLIQQLDASQGAFKNFSIINQTVALASPVPNKMHTITPPSRSKAIGRTSSISELGDVKPPVRKGESRSAAANLEGGRPMLDLQECAKDDIELLMSEGADRASSSAVTLARVNAVASPSNAPLEEMIVKALMSKNKQLEATLARQEQYRLQEQRNLTDKLQELSKRNEELEIANASLRSDIHEITDSLTSTQEALHEMALQSDTHADKATVVEKELHHLKRRFSSGPDDSFLSMTATADDHDSSTLSLSPLQSKSSEQALRLQIEHLQKRLELTEAEVTSRMQSEVLYQLSEKEKRISYLESLNTQLCGDVASSKAESSRRINELEKLSAEQNALIAGVGDQVDQITQLRLNLKDAKEALAQATFCVQQERDNCSILNIDLASAKKEADGWHDEVVALKTALRSREHGKEEEGTVLRDLRRSVEELTKQNIFSEIEVSSLRKEVATADEEIANARSEHRDKESLMISELEHMRVELKHERNLLLDAASARDALSARVQGLVTKQAQLEAELASAQERRAREGVESQAALTEMQGRIKALEMVSLEGRSQVADLSNKLLVERSAGSISKEKIAALERSTESLQQDTDSKSCRIEALEVEKIVNEGLLLELKDAKASAAREIASLTAKVESLTKQLGSSQEKISHGDEKIKTLNATMSDLEQQAQTLKRSLQETKETLEEEKRARESVIAEKNMSLKKNEGLSKKDMQLEEEIAQLRLGSREREQSLQVDLDNIRIELKHERNLLLDAASARDALSARVQGLVTKQAQLEAELASAQERRAREGVESQAALTEMQGRIKALEMVSLEGRSQVADLSNKLLVERSAGSISKEKIAALERSMESLRTEYDDVSVKRQILQHQVSSLEDRILFLEGDVESEKKKVEAAHRLHSALKAAKDQSDAEIRALREDLNQYIKESDDVQIGHNETIKKLMALHEQRLRDDERAHGVASEELKSVFSGKENKLSLRIDSLVKERTSLEDLISDLQRRLQELEQEETRSKERIQSAKEETNRIQELYMKSLDRIEQLEMSAASESRRRIEFETMLRCVDQGVGSAAFGSASKSMQLGRRPELRDKSATPIELQPKMESEVDEECDGSSKGRRLAIELKMRGKGWISK